MIDRGVPRGAEGVRDPLRDEQSGLAWAAEARTGGPRRVRGPRWEEGGGTVLGIQATRSQAALEKRERNWSTISAWRWQTRDSLTPRTTPIADMVSFS